MAPAPTASVSNPAIRNDNVAVFNDVHRGYRQTAFFTAVDFDIIPKVLTVTGGTRYYNLDNTEPEAVTGSFGCYEAGLAPCLASATNIDSENLLTKYKGFTSRGNVTWHFMPDATGTAQYCSPSSITSDVLTNNELGWKTEFFDRRFSAMWGSARTTRTIGFARWRRP